MAGLTQRPLSGRSKRPQRRCSPSNTTCKSLHWVLVPLTLTPWKRCSLVVRRPKMDESRSWHRRLCEKVERWSTTDSRTISRTVTTLLLLTGRKNKTSPLSLFGRHLQSHGNLSSISVGTDGHGQRWLVGTTNSSTNTIVIAPFTMELALVMWSTITLIRVRRLLSWWAGT